ncbi:MAG: hypothetical protein ACE5I4_03620 [Thermoplasmata archaeon]
MGAAPARKSAPVPPSPGATGWEPGRGAQPWDRRVLSYLLIVTGVIIAVTLLGGATSDLRFTVFVWVLLVAGIMVFLFLRQREVQVPPLEAPSKEEDVRRGDLGRLAETLGRADRGMRFSQVAIARRVRQAFLIKMRQEYGLDGAAFAALLADPGEFVRLIKDPLIREFLEDTAPAEDTLIREQAATGASTFRFTRRVGFTAGIAQVLEAMEEAQ